MVFQKPNPFPKSIYENIAWGAKINGYQGNMDELVERSLRQAALWDEVKDKLQGERPGALRWPAATAVHRPHAGHQPDVILMDEPASALDPISTLKIEDLMRELERHYTIVIVTHNMQQAARVSDQTSSFRSTSGVGGFVEAGAPATCSPTHEISALRTTSPVASDRQAAFGRKSR